MPAAPPLPRASQTVTNAELAELLANEAEQTDRQILAKAYRCASRLAFLWPHEASDMLDEGIPLTELPGVGPFLSGKIQHWLKEGVHAKASSELRKNFLTLTQANAILARNSQWKTQYKGDLQMHTEWSDGSATLAEMAQNAIDRGYEYIGITDHSKGLKIAGGIDEKTLAEQCAEIDSLNRNLQRAGTPFRVLKSVELNLNPAGQGDMEDDIFEKLDLVVGSFHSALRTTADQTERYLAALQNAHVHILGHPRGRIYNYRIGLKADWPRVFERAAELHKAVEIDSYPDRQDVDVKLLRLAKSAGCKIAIDTDAHHPEQLYFSDLGLAAALLAKIEPANIINFMNAEELLKWAGRS